MSLISTTTSAIMTIILYLSLFLFCLISTLVVAYDPVDLLSISCGFSDNSSDGDRTWTGDINSKLLSLQDNQTVAAAATVLPPSANQVPYATARLSHSQFTYSFPVTAGLKFVRLFFYPASYPRGFDRPNALFTVKSGRFTLLKDFNASLAADADQRDTIFREYIINVDDGERLNLDFTPSTLHPNSYAFVNGIEVVSMPTYLYYTEPNDQGFKLVGFSASTQYSIGNNTALETEYRLKVGGRAITPKDDTGMLRRWEGDDANYLMSSSAVPLVLIDNITVSVIPDYIAPSEIYRTTRFMGLNATLNEISNLTWVFPVDSGFYYMLRLHFCELYPNIADSYDRAFYIYIAEQLAEDRADVLRWSKQKGVAVHRDYAVLIQGNQKKANLSLQMHPLPDRDTYYSAALLKGLEIFKISDIQSNNLAGPNPDPVPVPSTAPNSVQNPNDSGGGSSGSTIIGVAAGVVSGVVLLSIIVAFFLLRRQKKTKKPGKDSKSATTDGASKWGPLSFSTTKSTNTLGSSLPSDLYRHFSLVKIKAATNNFDELFIIGVGGFGHVYKGYIDGGAEPVAIKRLKPGSRQGAHEFKTEIEMLSQLRHLHLVSLIGYCNESNEMILVYDFMARGTLREHLYDTDKPSLPWKQRLQICIGAARGLHYLHTGAKHTIIHRDVKTTNILLDEEWVAKLSDFGLSRIGPTGVSTTHVSTAVKGSIGYMDPEYYKRHRLTQKSDVYSFGVVLFEVLCARPPLLSTVEDNEVLLPDWARCCWDNGTLAQIVDPALKGEIAPESLSKFGEIGVRCLLDEGAQRPSMMEVVSMLEFVLQLQESVEQGERNSGMVGVDARGRDDSDDMVISV